MVRLLMNSYNAREAHRCHGSILLRLRSLATLDISVVKSVMKSSKALARSKFYSGISTHTEVLKEKSTNR